MLLQTKNSLKLSTALSLVMALGLGSSGLVNAAEDRPENGEVIRGDANINYNGLTTTITQSTAKAIINWDSFSLAETGSIVFDQIGANSVTLNRVTGDGVSNIYGSITAPGHVFLINQNGILFGEGSNINVGGLVASTFDISNNNFWSGNYVFDQAGVAGASVQNFGSITIKDGGLAAFVAPYVANAGIINARLGTVSLGASETGFALDFYGDGLIKFVVQEETQARLGLGADSLLGVDVSGQIMADGGTVAITADVAREVVSDIITIGGEVRANSLVERDGKIILFAGDNTRIRMDEDAVLDVSGTQGGSIEISGDVVLLDGEIDASGDGSDYKDALGYLYGIGAQQSIIDTVLDKTAGGSITVDSNWFSLGGILNASGSNGGSITIDAGSFSNTGATLAMGSLGNGGIIDFDIDSRVLEFDMAYVDASGLLNGGSISMTAGHQITSSGTYLADGLLGDGGNIDVTASVTKSLSAQYGARGGVKGGRIRFGGEFQGGKNLADGVDELANADVAVVSSGSVFDVTGGENGGEVIIWSDSETIFQGAIFGDGAFVEVSSAGNLEFVGDVQIGDGELLLDPKNLIIVADDYITPSLSLVLGYQYSDTQSSAKLQFGNSDSFGSSVSLDGTHLAVGARGDDGFNNDLVNAGAVYLFSFVGSELAHPTLSAIIGADYTGGYNIDNTSLEASDIFGSSVALDGNHLAVGAYNDGGNGNGVLGAGAVYLYSFFKDFTGLSQKAIIGAGYTGGENVDNTALEGYDNFGISVALDGTHLAVGATYDDGSGNVNNASGAVYLYSFTGDFSAITEDAIIGLGYTGGNNVDNAVLEVHDYFGAGVALSGNLLAIGADNDDGSGNGLGDSGAVYLYSFSGNFTSITQEAIIGADYTGGNNVDNNGLGTSDYFGISVALDGTHLAVGAKGDDGLNDDQSASGAVYLYNFTGNFTTISQQAIIGYGYTGGNNVDNTALEQGSWSGNAVALDGNHLAIGSYADEGADNSLPSAGAVYLYSFTGEFTNISHDNTLGYGYALDLSLEMDDNFGSSVALDGNHLAVGALGDDGYGNAVQDSGAVYLFTFIGEDLTNPILSGIIGADYTGGNNRDNTALAIDDNFGAAVALDGNLLAVGASGDDGNADAVSNSGAVYLYSFSGDFKGITQEATLGAGYTGGNNVDNAGLESNDNFGSSIALGSSHLAVGTPRDDGNANAVADSGAVYLYSYTGDFTGLTQDAILGAGYTGGNNVDNTALDAGDFFGSSVALDGSHLAVGAKRDAGFYDSHVGAGAVYLYSFTGDFTAITQNAVIGLFYSGGNNLGNNGLYYYDYFGDSVALDGNHLAVGASGDDGTGTFSATNSGAVLLYSFTGDFTALNKEAVIGSGYATGNNIHAPGVETLDEIGSAVALDGNHLVIGGHKDSGGDNSVTSAGSVNLYSFTDDFTDITHESAIGQGYAIDFTLEGWDYFGSAVALDGNHLAVGAQGDDGNANAVSAAGAVYLFTFVGSDLKNPLLSAIIGSGYTGGNNVDNTALEDSDYFGSSVALDGDHLAVGAIFDDGSGNVASKSGAVYLYNFSGDFTAITQQAIIGLGYTGGNNVNVTSLEADDQFGKGVALDGSLLAIGAIYDDGSGNILGNSGAVYLYGFYGDFTSLTQQAVIGSGYTGGNNVDNIALEASDYFGSAISLDGKHLAVGAYRDDGSGNLTSNSGAVYLYSFSGNFTGLTQEATIGAGYTGGNNVDNTGLENSDQFGQAVALDGGHLAISALYDAGNGNVIGGSGAVYLYSFTDDFTSITDYSIIGAGYTGGNNLDHTQASTYQFYGQSIALDGKHLAVGAISDGGADGGVYASGKVYLYTVYETVTGATGWNYGDDTGADSIVYISQITDLLDAGTAVTLQASNDLTLNTSLLSSGNSGALTFQAGRSVLLNGNITTGNHVTIIANDTAANGVVDADRDAGAAEITMAAGTNINTNGGNFYAMLSTGEGNSNSTSGDISLYDITAGTILVENLGTSNGDVVVNGTLWATDEAYDGTPLVVASLGGDFINNFGEFALITEEYEGAQRWLVYSQNPGANINGNLDGTPWYNTLYDSTDPSNISGYGNRFVYNQTAILTVTVDDASRTYGAADPAFTYSLDGYVNGETSAVGGGTPWIGTDAIATTDVGTAAITSGLGSLWTDHNYYFQGIDATLTITKADLTVTASDGNISYNGTAYSGGNGVIYTGLVAGDTSADLGGILNYSGTSQGAVDVGSYGITVSGLTATNYALTFVDGSLSIDKADLTITASDDSRTYDGTAYTIGNGVTYTGFVNGETTAVLGGTLNLGGTAQNAVDAGTYDITASGLTADNYALVYVDGTLTTNKVDLTVTAGDDSRTYDGTAYSGGTGVTYAGFVNGETTAVLGGSLGYTGSSQDSVDAGSYAITGDGLTATNYAFVYVDGTLTTNTVELTVTASDDSRTYDATAYSGGNGATYSGFVGDDTSADLGGALGYSGTSQGSVDVGSYGITASGLTSTNYTFSFVDGTLTTNKADLTVTAEEDSRTYDGTAYSGGNGVIYTGFAGDDTSADLGGVLAYSGTAQDSIDAGSYGVTVDGLTATNYTISYVDGTLTTSKADLTVTAEEDSRTYDGTAYSGGNGVIYTGFAGDDSTADLGGVLAYSGTAQDSIDAGSYAITGDGLTATNYTISYVDGTLTTSKADLTVTAEEDSRTYDGTAYSGGNGVIYTGFAGDDSTADLGGVLAYSGTAQDSIDAGSYGVTVDGLTSTNYTISYVDGTLTTSKADLTVTAEEDSRTYDGTAYSGGNGVIYTGFAGDDTSADLGGVLAYSGTAQDSIDAGSYAITGDGLTATNYTISYVDGTLTTSKADLTVTAEEDSRTYDGTAYSGGNGVIYSGLVGDETSDVLDGTLEYTGSSQGSIEEGPFVITPAGLTSTNYAVNFVDGTLTTEASEPAEDPNDPVNDPPQPPQPPAISDPLPDTDPVPAPADKSAIGFVASAQSVLVVANPITDEIVISNTVFAVELPNGIFDHVDDTATYTITATLVNGDPLPEWMSYDASTNTVSGTAPTGFSGVIEILLTAEDAEDNTAQTTVTIQITAGE